MPVLELVTSSGLGSLLGMRHALEPDHLAAVSTLVTAERSSAKAALLGACWGLGHTGSLIVVGTILVLLRAEMPGRVANGFEFLVALMLIGLGLRAISLTARPAAARSAHLHPHGPLVHAHSGIASHVHVGTWMLAQRPLLIGAMHGLAGSGALTALVVAALPSPAARITYMALFGMGSTVGMTALTGLLGWPLARFGQNRQLARALSLGVGCVSIVLGVCWGYPLLARLLGS